MNDLVTITMDISQCTKQLGVIRSVLPHLVSNLLNMMNVESDKIVKTKHVEKIVVKLLKHETTMSFIHKIVGSRY